MLGSEDVEGGVSNFKGWENVTVKDGKLVEGKQSKYRNERSGKYASKWEELRAGELKWLKSTGQIKNLREQVKYELKVQGVLICSYIADFLYDEPQESGGLKAVVEDTKSPATRRERAYRIKKKLFLVLYPQIEFREILKGKGRKTKTRWTKQSPAR